MSPVGKALWYVERHFAGEIALEEIAQAAGVSRFHMTRAFGEATGYSIMRYVRGRRLSEAARSLADGAPDILAVALDAGYNSHEAFTRAFRDRFGFTPEAVRAQCHLDNVQLLDPIKMQVTLSMAIEPPRFENGKVSLIGGLGERYSRETGAGIPAQWQRFMPHLGAVPRQVGRIAYGVCCNQDDDGNFDYICGVEVSGFAGLPLDWTRLRIAAAHYAVFSHPGHISTIRSTWNTVWNKWFPESGREAADAPFFERYGEEFDSKTGMGGLELWVPAKG